MSNTDEKNIRSSCSEQCSFSVRKTFAKLSFASSIQWSHFQINLVDLTQTLSLMLMENPFIAQ